MADKINKKTVVLYEIDLCTTDAAGIILYRLPLRHRNEQLYTYICTLTATKLLRWCARELQPLTSW